MGSLNRETFKVYILPIFFIGGWWLLTFFSPQSPSSSTPSTTLPAFSPSSLPDYFSYLSPLNREEIQQALSGDTSLMARLIREWDVDAEILESQKVSGIKRLSRIAFVKAQMLGRKLLLNDEKEELKKQILRKEVRDDAGVCFSPGSLYVRFLPQTFASASFLLALTEPENIIALPHGLRTQTSLYPRELTEKIPLDTDRHKAEELYLAKPDLAFVADYSHPSTLETLSKQGIPLFMLKSINTVPQVEEAIQRIGSMIGRPLEAELLATFMESAMLAIDNRLLALSQQLTETRIMVLNYYMQYSVPTKKTIGGQLIRHLAEKQLNVIPRQEEASHEWEIPINQEQIVNFDPDCIIIATSQAEDLKERIQKNSAFRELSARKNDRIFFIDGLTQAPTQYIILAYYDLAHALMRL